MGVQRQPAEVVEAYTTGERRRIIVAAVLGWGLEYYDFLLPSLLAVAMMRSLHVGPVTFGLMYTVQLVATALGGVVFGWLADILGRRTILTATMLVYSLGTGFIYLWHTVPGLFVLRFVSGFGIGGEWAVGFSLLNEAWVPRRRGLAGGFTQGTIFLGFAIAILVVKLIPTWPLDFAVGAFPALAAVWVRFFTPESKQWIHYMQLRRAGRLPEHIESETRYTPLVQIFLSRYRVTLLVATAVVLGGEFAAYVMLPLTPSFLQIQLHLAGSQQTLWLYVIDAIEWIGYILAGWIGDLWGRRRAFLAAAWFQVLALLLFAGAVLGHAGGPVVLGVFLLVALGLGYFGIYGVWFGELFPTRMRTSASAFAYNVGRGLAAAAPAAAGALVASKGYGIAMSLTLVGTLIAAGVAFGLGDRTGRLISAAE